MKTNTIMNNLKTHEENLIRSRALAALFSIILSALILLPFITSARDKKNPEAKETVYMQALNNESMAAVSITNIEADRYLLTIESHDGTNVYFNKNLNNIDSFAKVFDLSRLDDGAYTVKLINGKSTTERNFNINGGKIEVKYENKINPLFSYKGNKAQVEFSRKLKEAVYVTIYSSEGEELHNELIESDVKRKQFDFSNVEKGNYKVIVYSMAEEFAFDYQK